MMASKVGRAGNTSIKARARGLLNDSFPRYLNKVMASLSGAWYGKRLQTCVRANGRVRQAPH